MTLLIAAAIVTANGLCIAECRRYSRTLADRANLDRAAELADRAAKARADRLRSARPSIRPAGIIR